MEENKEDIKSIEGTFPKDMSTYEIKNEIDEIKKLEDKIKRIYIYKLLFHLQKCQNIYKK